MKILPLLTLFFKPVCQNFMAIWILDRHNLILRHGRTILHPLIDSGSETKPLKKP